jgi:hypothetical protein
MLPLLISLRRNGSQPLGPRAATIRQSAPRVRGGSVSIKAATCSVASLRSESVMT